MERIYVGIDLALCINAVVNRVGVENAFCEKRNDHTRMSCCIVGCVCDVGVFLLYKMQ